MAKAGQKTAKGGQMEWPKRGANWEDRGSSVLQGSILV